MTLPVLNAALLPAIVTWAYNDANPLPSLSNVFGLDWGHHDQGSWAEKKDGVCGSSYCIAGQAAVQVGYKMHYEAVDWDMDEKPIEWRAHYASVEVFDGLDESGKPKFTTVGEDRAVSDIAREALGLNFAEATALFEAGNEVDQIIGFAMLFAAARGITLDVLPEVWESGLSYLNRRAEYSTLRDQFYFFDYEPDEWEAVSNVLSEVGPKCHECGQRLPS